MLSRLLQISIYRLDDETNTVSQEIDLAILKALLKGMFNRVVPYFVWLHVLERELILYPVGFFADACEVLFLERRLERKLDPDREIAKQVRSSYLVSVTWYLVATI